VFDNLEKGISFAIVATILVNIGVFLFIGWVIVKVLQHFGII